MRFFVKFSPIIKIVLYTISFISLAMLIFSILSLCEVYTFLNWTIGQGAIMLPTSLIAIVVSLSLATMHYKVDDKHLRIKLLFFDVLSGRIRIENILNIVYSEGKMYLSYIWKGQDPVIANVMISCRKFDALKQILMSKNKGIVFYEDKDETTDSQQQ